MASDLTVDGYDALLKRLAEIEDDLQNRITKAALRAGAKEIQQSIRDEVRISNKNETHIRDDIKIGTPKKTDTGWTITIGPGRDTAWRAKFLEFGHSKPGGQVPAYPFMEPGLKASQEKFRTAVANVLREEL